MNTVKPSIHAASNRLIRGFTSDRLNSARRFEGGSCVYRAPYDLIVMNLNMPAKPKYLKAKNIIFKPGVNGELAAVAVSGTQQLGCRPAGHEQV